MNAALISKASTAKAYSDIYEQFAVDASFLWLLRSIAVKRPHYTAADLIALERRIDAQLDGLMTAPEECWEICRAAMETQAASEVFAGSVFAFRSLDVTKIQQVVECGLASEKTFAGLVAALGWLPGRLCHSWIKKFLTSKNLDHKYLAIAACSVRREDPRDYLTTIFQREDCLAHKNLYARALRLVGELKRRDLMPALRIALRSGDPDVNFWASWSALMLGDRSVVENLQPFVLQPNPHQIQAIQVAFRTLPVEEGRAWISALAKRPTEIRNVIKATGILGDPHAVHWLIRQMRVPSLTRLAGEAFTMITGIDLQQNMLALNDLPNLDAHLPNDDPEDENVDMDEDEDLPFPDADKVAAVWQKYQQRFVPGQRYLMGKGIAVQDLSHILSSGYQRQRHAAALELALLQPSEFLFNCAAKGLGSE